MEDSLALELLHELKKSSKRWFIAFIVTLILLFITNIIWIGVFITPVEETTTTTSYDVQSDNGSNAIYNGDGEVNINGGKSDSNKDNIND